MTSILRETMSRQPDDLRRLLGDLAPVSRAAEVVRRRRVLLAGTGTSWHAAGHGAALLRLATFDGVLSNITAYLAPPAAPPPSRARTVTTMVDPGGPDS